MIPANKPELLAPGGNLQKALTALRFGADAVYVGGTAFGLRAAAGNLTDAEMQKLLAFAHAGGKKVYVTLNILPRSREIAPLCRYAAELQEQGVDGAIVADLGAFLAIHREVPDLPLHVSTQANNLNADTCRFWTDQGAVRINLARELELSEIREIGDALSDAYGSSAPGLEVFVHGAMCMAYSGRCMLSDYLTGRSSNRGECAQPCRWQYTLTPGTDPASKPDPASKTAPYLLAASMTEEKRPGQIFGVEETGEGTFLFNSKDLCLLPYLHEVIGAGASALKIEGRMKSDFYVGVTVRAYREAIDRVWDSLSSGGSGELDPATLARLIDEVSSVSHRDYSDGFLHGGRGEQVYGTSSYIRNSVYAGLVEACSAEVNGYRLTVSQRGNFGVGETLEFVQPSGPVLRLPLAAMTDSEGQSIDRAAHACMTVLIRAPFPVEAGSIARVRKP